MGNSNAQSFASPDGTLVSGERYGSGPSLVFISGALGDETGSWPTYPPAFTDAYTCWLMSTRGRGASGDNEDHSLDRMVEDIVAFVRGAGGPAGLVGHSSAGALALEAASRCDEVGAVAVYEPTLYEFADPETVTRVHETNARIRELVAAGSAADAALLFVKEIAHASDEELDFLSQIGAPEGMARYVPTVMQEFEQWGPPNLSRLSVLDDVQVPVLVMRGSETPPFWVRVAEELDARLADVQHRVVEGAGHLGPMFSAEVVAEQMRQFFDTTPVAASV